MKISPQLPRIHSNTTNSMPYCYWVSTLEQQGKQNTLLCVKMSVKYISIMRVKHNTCSVSYFKMISQYCMVKHEASFKVLGPAHEFQLSKQYFKFNPWTYSLFCLWHAIDHLNFKSTHSKTHSKYWLFRSFPTYEVKKKFSTKIFPHDQHICYPLHMIFA